MLNNYALIGKMYISSRMNNKNHRDHIIWRDYHYVSKASVVQQAIINHYNL